MFIEDLIWELNSLCSVNRFDGPIVNNFAMQAFTGNGFTEKQSLLAVKLLKRYSAKLSDALKVDITSHLDNPTFKYPVRKMPSSSKRISIVDHVVYKRAIKVEFPFDQAKVDAIREHKQKQVYAMWDAEQKAWIFGLEEKNIKFLSSLIRNENFNIDEEFKNYLDQIETIVGNMENHVPMLTILNGAPKYLNQSQFVPELTSNDVISAVFEARNAGIFTWDEKVDQYINEPLIDPITKEFLSHDHSKNFEIDSEKHSVQCLKDIVKYAQPVLFIIPGGSELSKTKLIYNFLVSQGYTSDEMSVMFRLPNLSGKEFNEFVKNCGLNNPITEKTKFVFVSIKLPKPVLKSNLSFNSVISLGRSNVHYTIREFFKNRLNLIYYCELSKQREFNFGFM